MFIGDKEIESAADVNGGPIKIITYKDGSFEQMLTKLYNASVSPEPLDATGLRDLQMRPVAGDILLVLFDWNIKWMDYDFVDSLVRTSLQEHMKAADAILWGKAKEDVTIKDIDNAKHS